jgi:phosphoribosylanthranilate isomerase
MERVRVKICGITNAEDALVAAEAGADYLGFILYSRSQRYVDAETVREIVAAVRAGGYADLQCVGVFVNSTTDEIAEIMDAAALDWAQLHGDEPPAALAALAGRAFKALRPATLNEALATAELYAAPPDQRPGLLIDAYHPQHYGGTGQAGDWALAAAVAARHPGVLLAGGLTPDNVAAASAAVHPWGVDVSSGVERSPGRKDHNLVRRFLAAARAAT